MQQIQVKSGFKNINKKNPEKSDLEIYIYIKKNQVPYHYITDGGKTQKKTYKKKRIYPKN